MLLPQTAFALLFYQAVVLARPISRCCSCEANTDFDPIDLDMHVTPANVAAAMSSGDHMQALLLALRLNERPLLQRVYESVPVERIPVMAANLPRAYVSNMCDPHVATRA